MWRDGWSHGPHSASVPATDPGREKLIFLGRETACGHISLAHVLLARPAGRWTSIPTWYGAGGDGRGQFMVVPELTELMKTDILPREWTSGPSPAGLESRNLGTLPLFVCPKEMKTAK
jgi:hypothetical protein